MIVFNAIYRNITYVYYMREWCMYSSISVEAYQFVCRNSVNLSLAVTAAGLCYDRITPSCIIKMKARLTSLGITHILFLGVGKDM